MAGQKSYFGKDDITPSFLQKKASNSLRGLESAAVKKPTTITTPQASETNPGFTYTGGNGNNQRQKRKVGKKSKIKRGASILIILATLIFGGFTIVGSPSILGPHLEALFTSSTDTQYSSYSLRSRHLVTEALDGKIRLTPYMKARLEKSGIEVHKSGLKTTLTYKGQTIDSKNFKKVYAEDLEFREAYTSAKRSRVANFFDNAATKIYQKLGLSRDVFNKYKTTGDDVADDTAYRNTMTEIFDGENDTRLNSAEDKVVKDEETGEETTQRAPTGDDVDAKSIEGDTPTAKARSYLAAISGKVAAANVGCAVLKVGNMVAIAVAANEIYQSINYFMPSVENASKTKAGYGTNAALNPFLNTVTASVTTTMTDAETGEDIEITGAPIEAEGMKLILGSDSANKSVAKNFSIERLFGATLAAMTMNGYSSAACNTARAAGAIISLSAFAIPGGGLVKALIGTLLEVGLAVGFQATIAAVLGFMIPSIAKAIFSNTFTEYKGKPSGERLASGASAANMRVARSSSGQSPSSAESILAYNHSTNAIIAEDNEIIRKHTSPFDVSNPNTFFGTIASKFLPLINSKSSLTTTISSVTSLARSAMNPLTYAEGENTSYITTFGDCPTLEKIGAKGDIYCNPITTADLSIITVDTDDATYRQTVEPHLEIDEEGNEKVKDNSELANYIIYCTERDSPFGVLDANIANAFETSLGIIGDNLPILNDIIDIVNAAESEAAEPWATGAICVNSEKNPDWSRMKYYQRYIEDTRIQDQMGMYEDGQNPITAFKDHYYEEHPLDNSRAGYLSRISGLTKEDAETVIAIMDYKEFLEDYHPETAYQFGETIKPKKIFFESNSESNFYVISSTFSFYTKEQEVTA